MAFYGEGTQGKAYNAGSFLAHEECVRETREIPQSIATTVGTAKYVKAGTFFPANDSSVVEGIVYEDTDVTVGNMPGSVVTEGIVYLDKLPAAPESGVQSALEAKGFKFIASTPSIVRPEYPTELKTLTVTSAEGQAVGKTAISVSGYSLGTGEKWAYKIADTAPSVIVGEVVDDTWTQVADFTTEIASTDNKKIAVVALSTAGEAKAYGTATVDVK